MPMGNSEARLPRQEEAIAVSLRRLEIFGSPLADGCCEVKAPLVINRCCFLVQNIGHVTHGVIKWDPWNGGNQTIQI